MVHHLGGIVGPGGNHLHDALAAGFRRREIPGGHQIGAEEMLHGGWRGTPAEREFLDHEQSRQLLREARASSNLSREARASFLENEIGLFEQMGEAFEGLAEEQAKRLVAAHGRFSALMEKQRFQVVYPVLPMDLMGVYILLPEVAS